MRSNFSPKVKMKRTTHALCVIKPHAQLAKGGAMPQFFLLFYAILQSWRPKGGSHGTMAPPLNTPLILIRLRVEVALITDF